jgi:hypothetical protein
MVGTKQVIAPLRLLKNTTGKIAQLFIPSEIYLLTGL